MLKNGFKLIVNAFVCFNISFSSIAGESSDFDAWLAALKSEAKAVHISAQTIDETFENAEYLPRVIVFDRGQPEFISPFLSYVEKRVTTDRVAQGRALLFEHETLLSQIEVQYGVPKQILMAFWGLETNYGSNKGDFSLPSSLMTLAYEGRRAAFFRNQLFDTMRVVDAGHNTVAGMRGSWAGAMGHMQFMPSTLLKYGVDADADGRINIWTSLPDAFASAANYLSQVGWHKAELAAVEVTLPANFDYSLARLNYRQHALAWTKLGVLTIEGNALPEQANAAILLPQGQYGPAFMIFSNFDVIMDWNRSVNYALSVVHLANQLKGDKPIVAGDLAEKEALSFNQMWALQSKLNELGFDCGQPDGFPGLKTQAAIRQYQATQRMTQDGYASPSLYQRLFQP
ncbi:MAG: lytic murein transglycosylase [Pseudomonadota bacterium]